MLLIKPACETPHEAVESTFNKYWNEKATKMIAHHKLKKLLRLKIKNYNLKVKTEKERIFDCDLTMDECNWISLSDQGNIKHLIALIGPNKLILENLKTLYSVQRQLFNILNNHFSIRNSLDTQFVVGKLNEIHKILSDTRIFLAEKMNEIDFHQTEESKTDESFNPFIEINEHNEEAKMVDLRDRKEEVSKISEELTLKLTEEAARLNKSISTWIESMPEPEALNVGAKQATLNRKLRWEKMITSNEKVKQLQGIFKMLRGRKMK